MTEDYRSSRAAQESTKLELNRGKIIDGEMKEPSCYKAETNESSRIL